MKRILLAVGLICLPTIAFAQSPMKNLDLGAVQCNWGVLSMQAIIDLDFDTGFHSADPDNDGIGRDDPDRNDPRVGLPNLLGQGDLVATCELVGCMLFPEDPICEE